MTITGMVRTIGKKVFSLLVALCLVGVFFSVSFAEEAGMNRDDSRNSASGNPS